MEGADPPSPSPDPCYLPALTKKKKNQGERSSKMSGQPVSQSASCTLALSSGLDIEEGSTALLLPLLLSLLYVCVCVCEEAWWNEMPGLGYLQGEPLHPITWASQQHSGIGEKLHPSSDGPPEDQAWSNGRGDFFFFNHSSLLWREGIVVTPHIHPFLKIWGPLLPRPPTLFLFFTPSFF